MNDEFYVGPGVHLHHEDRVGPEIAAAEEPSFAAWTTPITHATGDVFPASDWNTYIRDNLNYLYNGRGHWMAYHNAAQSLANATETSLSLNTELLDPLNQQSGGTVTFARAGFYLVMGTVDFSATSTVGRRFARFTYNSGANFLGVDEVQVNASSDSYLEPQILLNSAAGATLSMTAFQGSGGALNVNGGSQQTTWYGGVEIA